MIGEALQSTRVGGTRRGCPRAAAAVPPWPLLCHQGACLAATPCSIIVEGGTARGVVTADGRELQAKAVVVNADPFRLRQLAGAANFTPELNAKLDGMRMDGTTMKARGAGGAGLAGRPARTACQPAGLPARALSFYVEYNIRYTDRLAR